MLGSFGLLLLGLFQTQLIKGHTYRKMSENNRIRLIRLEAPRGNLYDRRGTLLATNRPAYHVYVIPEDFNPGEIPILSELLKLGEADIRKRMSEVRHASFTPVLLKSDVSKEVAMRIEERRPKLGGVFIQVRPIRTYPQGELGSHVIGYIGKITKDEYEVLDRSVYHFNSWIGRSGIERAYDLVLRGEDGGRQLEVDARGVPIRMLQERKSRPGSDIYLSVDGKLQSKLRSLLADRRGAILLMDLKTGELLSALSTPDYDPNVFVTPSRSQERLQLIGSHHRPLLDRGFNGLYPPGSIFKLVTAMAALETRLITRHTTFHCPGYFQLGPRSRKFGCWFEEGHGRVDLLTAIERSCNVYFYQVGRLLGPKRLASYARQLGFGSKVPLEIPTAEGLVPDADWKETRSDEPWYAGETISFAIGQSYLLVSPLQILRLIAAVATDGRITKPKLVPDVGVPFSAIQRGGSATSLGGMAPDDSDVRNRTSATHRTSAMNRSSTSSWGVSGNDLQIRPETFRVLRQGMLRAVASDKGTAQLARVDFGKLAAKTGTAQAPPGDPHAWFGGFYPYEDPQIALVVFVERGRSGGLTAARLAKQAVEIYNEVYAAQVA